MAQPDLAGLEKTPLFDIHRDLGARMVPFAGYAMPVQFDGVKSEHLHTREAAGIFDVSHMGQVIIGGKQAAEKLETLVPADLIDLPVNHQTYTMFTNERGGIRDDLIITRLDEDRFMLVVNAGCKQADLAWLQKNLSGLDITVDESKALLAVQGPRAVEMLEPLIPGCGHLAFMTGTFAEISGNPAYISRSGYTGEDGFEISLPGEQASSFYRQLLDLPLIKPVGLGARDTLRLEAGLCLYGHDLNENITPVTAGLQWSIGKARREGGARPGGFPGAEVILDELEKGAQQIRVGLKVNGKAPVREGTELIDENNLLIGRVTSGSFGPSVDGPVAMAYVHSGSALPGTRMHAMVRGKPHPVTVTPMPFVPHRYAR